jgi:predicted RNase H-like nuclease (RuvC/YqgF family)
MTMGSDEVAVLQAEMAALRADMIGMRQELGMLQTEADTLEAWRVRYLSQEDQVIAKLFCKIDELVTAVSDVRADLSRIRGEREAERRNSLALVSVLSAACGGLAGTLFHG